MNLPMDYKSTEGLTSSGNSSVDKYGFQYAEDFNYEAYEEMMSEYFPVLARRSEKWSRLLKENTKVDKNLKVKRYVRKGVPSKHRTLIWMAASGAQQHLQMNCGYYNSLLKAHHDSKLEEAIRTDLRRTFPDNIQFHESSQPCLLNALYNVLLAYGHHNKDVGYCQGMNFIAGYLLIITTDEEKSFWLMDALLGRILPGLSVNLSFLEENSQRMNADIFQLLPSDYYTPAMLGLKTDQEVLGELVKTKMPAVWQVMTRHNVTWGLVVSKWFICLYIDVLPMETVLRIWDSLFYEGSKILFRVALTLISHNQKLILNAQNVLDTCQGFKQMTHGEFVENCHAFMQNIFTEPGSLSMATVTKLREICRERIQAQDSA